MDDLEKLEKLLIHWKEHNIEHAGTYREWAERTSRLGKQHLSDILNRLYNDTNALNALFDDAVKAIK